MARTFTVEFATPPAEFCGTVVAGHLRAAYCLFDHAFTLRARRKGNVFVAKTVQRGGFLVVICFPSAISVTFHLLVAIRVDLTAFAANIRFAFIAFGGAASFSFIQSHERIRTIDAWTMDHISHRVDALNVDRSFISGGLFGRDESCNVAHVNGLITPSAYLHPIADVVVQTAVQHVMKT